MGKLYIQATNRKKKTEKVGKILQGEVTTESGFEKTLKE